MLLIYTQKITPRISYVFKHICIRILGVDVSFTSVIEELIAFNGAKMSYGKQALGNEMFLQSHGLLTDQGIESLEVNVRDWDGVPCFFSVSDKTVLPFDIFAASFYLLSRYEEYLPHVKDPKGRYPASESIGVKKNFLQRPVVDIWAYRFRSVLQKQFPNLTFRQNKSTIHTLITAQEPYAFKQKGLFRSTVGFVNDLFSFKFRNCMQRLQVLMGLRRDPYDVFKWIVTNAKRSDNEFTVFFLLGDNPVFNESINTHRQKFKMLIKYIADYEGIGLIFSEESLTDYAIQKKERIRLHDIINKNITGSINANFLIDLPEIYRNLVELEVKRDFTMVYDDVAGFRAGTCTPFLFYDLDFEIKTPLVIHPIAATTKAFTSKNESETLRNFQYLMDEVKNVNGTFSFMFSNTDFSYDGKTKLWRDIFSEKLH